MFSSSLPAVGRVPAAGPCGSILAAESRSWQQPRQAGTTLSVRERAQVQQCCAVKQDGGNKFGTYALIAVLVAIAGVLVYTFTADGGGSRQVWDPAHGHYHTVP